MLLVTGARLGDILGHRRMFLAGLVLFTLASLGCGLATSTGMLVALRFVQGAGAAAMIPQVLSLIQRTFTGPARARAMRLYSAVLAGGAVAGPDRRRPAGQRGRAGQHLAPGVPAQRADRAVLLIAGARLLPRGQGSRAAAWTLAGWLPCRRPCWPWCCRWSLASPSTGRSGAGPAWPGVWCLFGLFALVERTGGRGVGSPLIPARVLRLPGVSLGIASLFVTMAVFGGFFFVLACTCRAGWVTQRCGRA